MTLWDWIWGLVGLVVGTVMLALMNWRVPPIDPSIREHLKERDE